MKIVFNGDNHIQVSVPICRQDDFEATQIRKLHFIADTAKKHNALILNSGDITHKAVGITAPETQAINNFLLRYFPDSSGILGNHDVKYHLLEYAKDSLVSCLINSGKYNHLTEPTLMGDNVMIYPFNYGAPIQHSKVDKALVNIALYHGFVSAVADEHVEGHIGNTLLQAFPEYDFILTGDNHERFTAEHDGRILINPGSIFRTTTKQTDFEPAIFLIDTETKTFEEIKIPIEKGVIFNDSAEEKKAGEARWKGYVDSVKSSEGETVKFGDEVDAFLLANDKKPSVVLISRKAVVGE